MKRSSSAQRGVGFILTAQLAVAVSIGVRPGRDVPWLRVGLAILGILHTCGLARIRHEL
ncbi:hypothetical protein ACLQ24_29610 [Micromonospora sp. DT4]|uniref:hypothetical protein n=1 Tax=Micromonospora sp. DT4 TaxID=3393438 RepID=UPI003CF49C0C